MWRERDPLVGATRGAATHKVAANIFSFLQFQIALPPNAIGIILRAGRLRSVAAGDTKLPKSEWPP